MTRFASRHTVAWLVALSVLLMGTGMARHACAGACCAAMATDRHAVAAPTPNPHACCCDAEPVPCDLEQAPVNDLPDSAVTGVPRVDTPAPVSGLAALSSSAGPSSPVGTLAHRRPNAQGPPGPLYLRHLALLC